MKHSLKLGARHDAEREVQKVKLFLKDGMVKFDRATLMEMIHSHQKDKIYWHVNTHGSQ